VHKKQCRVYAFHEAYVFEVGKRNDERWLLLQCADPDFYSNLRQHSDLCTEVGFITFILMGRWRVRACVCVRGDEFVPLHRFRTTRGPACCSGR